MITKRPVSIILVLGLIALLFSVVLITMLQVAISVFNLHEVTIFELFTSFVRGVISLVCLSFSFWSILKRKPIGRWLGLFWVLVLLFGSIYMQFFASSSSRIFQRYEYHEPLLMNLIELMFTLLMYGYWAYAISFSDKARRYFDERYLQKQEQEKIRREEQEKKEYEARQ